jgi:hypothetical protein
MYSDVLKAKMDDLAVKMERVKETHSATHDTTRLVYKMKKEWETLDKERRGALHAEKVAQRLAEEEQKLREQREATEKRRQEKLQAERQALKAFLLRTERT